MPVTTVAKLVPDLSFIGVHPHVSNKLLLAKYHIVNAGSRLYLAPTSMSLIKFAGDSEQVLMLPISVYGVSNIYLTPLGPSVSHKNTLNVKILASLLLLNKEGHVSFPEETIAYMTALMKKAETSSLFNSGGYPIPDPVGSEPHTEGKQDSEEQEISFPELPKEKGIEPPGLVPLSEATTLLQQVSGTSDTSIYYVVGMGDLNIAARYAHGVLSVRVEKGTHQSAMKEFSPQLIALGFNLHNQGAHASTHLHVGSDTGLLSKTLGAILFPLSDSLDDIISPKDFPGTGGA